jgi:hypothetical protein
VISFLNGVPLSCLWFECKNWCKIVENLEDKHISERLFSLIYTFNNTTGPKSKFLQHFVSQNLGRFLKKPVPTNYERCKYEFAFVYTYVHLGSFTWNWFFLFQMQQCYGMHNMFNIFFFARGLPSGWPGGFGLKIAQNVSQPIFVKINTEL